MEKTGHICSSCDSLRERVKRLREALYKCDELYASDRQRTEVIKETLKSDTEAENQERGE